MTWVVAAPAAGVEQFSPQGEVKGVRQVQARFSTPMVPFGDPLLLEPFEIDCPVAGTGRWADARNWVFDFERDLPAGVNCRFALRAGVADLAGAAVAAAAFRFSTGGPSVRQSLPWEGSESVDENQIFILGLDTPATPESIAEHAWCDVTGRSERIPVRLASAAERKTILDKRADFLDQFGATLARGSAEDKALRARDYDRLPITLLACRSRLPNGAEVRLVWGKGIATTSGVATAADQTLAFRVRPAFIARFGCERVNAKADCIPVLPVRLGFSAPVAVALAERVQIRGPDGRVWKARIDDNSRRSGLVDGVSFAAPLPERTTLILSVPDGLTDDAGRTLVNAKRFPLAIKTDASPPLAKFAARFGIIEAGPDAALPITLRNVEKSLAGAQLALTGDAAAAAGLDARLLRVQSPGDVLDWLRRLDAAAAKWGEGGYTSSSVFGSGDAVRRFTVPRAGSGHEFEVVGIPFARPGFYIVEVVSPRLGKALLKDAKPYYVSAGALVTNLAVHFKWGRETSLVWVTTLDRGEPAAGADVMVQDCGGRIVFRGKTDRAGIARIAKPLPERTELPGCRNEYDRELFVTARAGADASFAFSDWNDGIAPWRFNVRTAAPASAVLATTVLDRSLVRAGDTVGMKHIVRRHTVAGFRMVNAAALAARAVVRHDGSGQQWDLPLHWDAAAGVAESSFTVPKDAKTGTYSITLAAARKKQGDEAYVDGAQSGTFRVEEFRVPALRAQVAGPVRPLVAATEAQIGVQLSYLSGGGAGGQRVKVRSMLQPRGIAFTGYDGFRFGGGDVREGVVEESPRGWSEASESEAGEQPAGQAFAAGAQRTQDITLDSGGAARVVIGNLPASALPRDLVAELEYNDPNGQILTRSARVPLWPSAVVLGVKPDGWALSKDKVRLQVVALDTRGVPLADVPVRVDLLERVQYAHRKRLIGGFYAYEYGAEVRRIGDFCEGRSDAAGLVTCEAPVAQSGNLILRAHALDDAGNVSVSVADAWVAGDGEWWFDVANDDRMDVIPERRHYEPGEKAVLQVRAPFRNSMALVTVEREGVIDAFVTPLSGKAPVVEVPLRGTHAPNVFVSVLAVRGRVAEPQPTALVDLGKPAFRMGVAEIEVGWRAHRLEVKVSAEKPVYKVRERATVSIEVARADGGVLDRGAEVAVVAIDEALLELLPNDSWKLLDTMMAPRGLEVQTATAAMQVVGKRHYGKKALPQGGGGGRQTTRELFDTLLLWKARVRLDEHGHARVEVPLNDSLSAFRIVAVATAAAGAFGTGEVTIRSSQDVILTSGLPPVVREQDRFGATFTVRNASAIAQEVSVSATAAATAGGKTDLPPLAPRTVQLAAGEARDLTWDIDVPAGIQGLRWRVDASTRGNAEVPSRDSVQVAQSVVPAVPVRVIQATLAQLDGTLTLPVARPAAALPGRGGVTLQIRPRLADDLSGVREFMERYPYSCLEQRTSVAISLRDAGRWKTLTSSLPGYLDGDGLAKYWPNMTEGSDTLTSYLLAIAHEAGWEIPDFARERMLGALIGFVSGTVVRHGSLPTADLAIRKIAALEALLRYNPALDAGLLGSVAIEPNLWPTSAVIDWVSLLQRWTTLPARDARLAEALQILRSRLTFAGTVMGFSTERSDYLWWLMISPDVNANRALLTTLDQPGWRDDLPRMARGSLARQQRGAWNTTVANAWGTLAMEKFSAAFETEAVAGQTRARVADQSRALDWARLPEGGTLAFDWPSDAAALTLSQNGSGKPWVTVQSRAALPSTAPIASGYRIEKRAVPVTGAGGARRGDVWRVTLDVDAQTDMTWVVVSDPIPAGATVLGTGLGGDSSLLTRGEKRAGWTWPAFEERTFEAFRVYYRLVPKGRWSIEYTMRLNSSGRFELPPTRVEAMYSPELFGELPNARFEVTP